MATQLNKSMVSELSIANQALGYLGANLIVSFDEPSTSAELMRSNYPFIRDAVMTEVAWTFATDRIASTTGDLDGWGKMYKHAVPLDWLQVLRVFHDVSRSVNRRANDWSREGNFILTKEPTVYMWGIKRIVDTSLFSAAFVQCLATRLAADLCMAITENQQQQGVLWQLYGAKVKEAGISDGVQGANEVIRSESYIDARYSGGGGFSV
jgi:hypothetical protein